LQCCIINSNQTYALEIDNVNSRYTNVETEERGVKGTIQKGEKV